MIQKSAKRLAMASILERHAAVYNRLAGSLGRSWGRPPPPDDLASRIEHTLLGVATTAADVELLCRDAGTYRFRAVCCLQRDVARCRKLLSGSGVLVVTVVDFPLAGGLRPALAAECAQAIETGADEVDVMADVRSLIQGDLGIMRDTVARVVEAARGRGVKVILETGFLTAEQIVDGCAAAEAGGAAFVKTASGFGPRGATVEDVRIMRAAVGDRLGVKAAGGIRTREDVERFVAAGADVIGTSSGPSCVD